MGNAIDRIPKSILILLPGIFILITWGFLIGLSYLSGELSLLQIIGYLATLVVGVIIGIISWVFPHWWSRPKLKILPDRPLKSGTLITHTLIVKNTGRSAALNCIGSITIQNITVDDLVTELPSELEKYRQALAETLPKHAGPIRYHLTKETFREVKDEKLCWSDIGNPARITINPALASGLDVYRVKPDEKHLYFPSDGGWANIKMVLKPKKYEGEITVSAENATPIKRKFTLIPTQKDVILKLEN